MKELQSKNIKVYRTDENGTIVCTSDGKSISFNCNPGDYSPGVKKESATNSNSVPEKKESSTTSVPSPPSNQNTQSSQPSQTVQQPAQNQNQNETVYVTNTGKKYHRPGCKYLRKSQIPMSLKDAQAQGYTPCEICNP